MIAGVWLNDDFIIIIIIIIIIIPFLCPFAIQIIYSGIWKIQYSL